MRQLLLVATYIALSMYQCSAQQYFDNQKDPYEDSSYFTITMRYLSDNVFLGRRDSVAIPYLNNEIGYRSASGFYTNLAISTTQVPKRHIDLFTIAAGYAHTWNERLSIETNVEKYFYNKTGNSVRGTSVGYGEVCGSYLNDWITPTILAGILVNKNSSDFVSSFALSHEFAFLDRRIHITPGFAAEAGSIRYLDNYYVNRHARFDKVNKVQRAIADANSFKLRDYQFSVQTDYNIKKVLLAATASYIAPQNAAVVVLPKRVAREHLRNSFVLDVSCTLRL